MLQRTASKSGCRFLLTILAAWLLSCGAGDAPSPTPEQQEQAAALGSQANATAADASENFDQSSTASSDAGSDASSTPVPETPGAKAVLAKLRARFTVKVPPEPREEDPAKGNAPDPTDGGVGAPVTKPVLGIGAANRFETGPSGVIPSFSGDAAARPARVALSKTATAPFRIEDAARGTAIEVTLRDGVDAAAEAAEGYLIYQNGHASGATLLHRALADGIEDYWSFDKRPAAPTVAYDLALRKGISGLRLVANTLEMLDGEGVPRLRVSPPTLMGANGAIVEAALSLDNCAYDQDPAPPWGRPVVAPGAESCTVRVIWPEDGLVYPALLDPKWSTTGSMSKKRTDHTATLLSNGKVLVAGGNDGTYVFSSAELYDRTTGAWAATGSMTGARMLHTATQLGTSSNATTSGKVLIAGGYNGSSTLNTAQLYSPTAGTWTAAANLNAARKEHTATLLANGKVLVAGGASGSTTLNTAAVYNPASGTGSWAAVGNMATARKFHTATLLATTNATLNNKVLVVGGRSSTASLTSVQLFDGTSSWTTLTSLSTAREQHTATVVANGKVLIAGGKSGTTTLASTLVFNPASGSGSWTSAGNMTSPRHGHSATLLSSTVLNNGQLLVAGGWNGSVVLSSAELWNGTSTWTLTTPLPAAVKYQTDTLLSNGVVLIAGGVDASVEPVSAAYLYDPSRGSPCTTSTQCASGFCANGVCCNTACADECGACNLTGVAGTCSPKGNGTACADEGNPCTVDKCNGSSLSCQHPAGNAGATCRPAASACDLAELCSGTSASCPNDAKKPNGTTCDDGDPCTAGDKCLSGLCVGGPPPVVDDGNPCTKDSCVSGTGPVHDPWPAGTSCDDNTICNGVETCDGAGHCIPGVPPFIDDGSPCTDDVCDATGVHHVPRPEGTSCGDLCSGVGACSASGQCIGGTPVTCTALDQCHGVGTCDPTTGQCTNPELPDGTSCEDGVSCTQGDTCQAGICGSQSHACTVDCPCDSGGSCTSDRECLDGFVCGQQNGRFFGKDPLSSNCWPPRCASEPTYLGCGHLWSPCGLCPPAPPRVCTTNTDCSGTNEVCGQGNGAAFGLGNVNVCWPPTCSGQTSCGSIAAPCGNCSCVTTCSSKTCSTPDKSDGCGGYCKGLCGDGQPGCASNLDCQNDSICQNGTCLPPACLALDPSRGCPGDHAACPNCPQCLSLCVAEGRECGPDPAGCSAGCGGCSGGLTCVDGKCRAPVSPPPPADDPTVEVGALEGSFSVTDSGEAQYNINIDVPPGRNGIQPGIGLVYTSDKRLGPAGIGWHIAGVSTIRRCSARAANEGPRAVRYDSGDRLCLDGKRLIAYGDGSYRTEVDTFSKITVTRDESGQPLSFKMYTKAGTILTYGDTENSTIYHGIPPSGPIIKRVWAVSRLEDRNGNTMQYTYETRRFLDVVGSPGIATQHEGYEMVPLEVSYGGNDIGQGADRGVRFSYEDVQARAIHYASGGMATVQRRLLQIETYARNAVARRYKFDYEDKGQVYRLAHAKECAPVPASPDVCKPQTTFTYDDGAAFGGPTRQNSVKPLASWHGGSADFNGDGVDEYWLVGENTSRGHDGIDGMPIDLDNDGKEELLLKTIGPGNELRLMHGATGAAEPITFDSSWQATSVFAADIDGDGIKDILVCSGTNLGYLKGGVDVSSAEFRSLRPLPSYGSCESDQPLVVDFDDDGTPNLMRPDTSGSNWSALVFPEISGEPTWVPIPFYSGPIAHFLTPDANGDGLVDILAGNTLWLNQGDGHFRQDSFFTTPTQPGTGRHLPFDFDGDGTDDLLGEFTQGRWLPPTLALHLDDPPASNLLLNYTVPDWDETFSPFLADVNGDGDLDLIDVNPTATCSRFTEQFSHEPRAACRPQIRYGHSRRMHLLRSVVDGLGRKTDIFYDLANGQATQSLGACAGQSDLLCPRKLPPLVSEHRFSTVGLQGTNVLPRKAFKYSYADARAGTNGRGTFGFGKRTIEEYDGDTSGPLYSTTELTYYNTDFARAGLLQSSTVTSAQFTDAVDGFVKSVQRRIRQEHTYEVLHNGINPTIVFPVLTYSTKRIFDVEGGEEQIVSTVINSFVVEDARGDFDDYGNSHYHSRRSFAGSDAGQLVSQTTTSRNFKEANPESWLVDLLESVVVTDTRPGGTPAATTRSWSYEHDDASGRLTKRMRDPGGAFEQVERFEYNDPVHNLTDHIIEAGGKQRSTHVDFDDASLIFPFYSFDALHHRVIRTFNPRDGALLSIVDPNGLTETRTYDAFGRSTGKQGPGGRIRIALKKGNEQLLFRPDPDPRAVMRVLTEELSGAGDKVGAMKIEDFGSLGEILKREVAGYQSPLNQNQWIENTYTYDPPSGRLVSKERPHLLGTSDQGAVAFFYDKLGMLVEERYPDGTSVYHAQGTRNTWLDNPLAYFLFNPAVTIEAITKRVPTSDDHLDALRKADVRAIDPEGLTMSSRDAIATFTDFTYGPLRELQTVQVGRASEITSVIEYDQYGRKKRHVDPDRGVETYDVYSGFDELESMTDGRGVNKTFEYDPLGRMIASHSFVTGLPVADETTTWEYDGILNDPQPNEVGRLVRVSTSTPDEVNRHVTRYHYQAGSFGLLQSVDRKIAAETFMTGFEYENDFKRLQILRYPDAGGLFTLKRTYDARGNLTIVSDVSNVSDPSSPGKMLWQVAGTSQGYRIESEVFGNGSVTTSSYEPLTGRLQGLQTMSDATPDAVPLQNIGYTYTPDGNLWRRQNAVSPRFDEYGYDDLDRLTTIQRDNQDPVELASYDPRGRIKTKVDVGTYDYAPPPSTFAPVHAPSVIRQGSVERSFRYDGIGNEISRTGGPEGTRTTDYTSFNLPSRIADTLPQAITTTFEYDGDQSRIIKVENGVRRTIYAGNLYERVTDSSTGGSPEVTHKYRVFANGKQIAQVERKQGTPQSLFYIHVDRLGSTQLITNGDASASSAFIVHEETFDPWGKPEGTATWDPAANPSVRNVHTGFTGHEHDPERGLINMRGRIYDPELGHFTTADPFIQSPFYSQSFNRYAYVFNNPLRYTDPSGFAECETCVDNPWAGYSDSSPAAERDDYSETDNANGGFLLDDKSKFSGGDDKGNGPGPGEGPPETPPPTGDPRGSGDSASLGSNEAFHQLEVRQADSGTRSAPIRGGAQPNNPSEKARARDAFRQVAESTGNVTTEMIGGVPVSVFGGTAVERDTTIAAARNVLTLSETGRKMRAVLESRREWLGFGQVQALEIVLVNGRGSFTKLGGQTIAIDANDVGSAYNSLRPGGVYTHERILAHELGHAAFEDDDVGIDDMWNVKWNENWVMRELGDTNDRITYH